MLPEKIREYQTAQQVGQNKSDNEIISISISQFKKKDAPDNAPSASSLKLVPS